MQNQNDGSRCWGLAQFFPMASLGQFFSGVFAVEEICFSEIAPTPLPFVKKRMVHTLVLLICSEKSDFDHVTVKMFVINMEVDFG